MKTSEIKTADSTSEECFGVSVVKISAQSDKIKEMLSVAQFATMHENPVLRKTRNKLDQRIFSPREVRRSVSKDFVGSFLWRI